MNYSKSSGFHLFGIWKNAERVKHLKLHAWYKYALNARVNNVSECEYCSDKKTKKNQDALPGLPPGFSLLGFGTDPTKVKYWRHKMWKSMEKDLKPKKILSDSIPNTLKLMYADNPEEVKSKFPDAARILEMEKFKLAKREHVHVEEHKEEEKSIFPYQINNNNKTTNMKRDARFSAQPKVPLSVKKLESSLNNLISFAENKDLTSTLEEEDFANLKDQAWRMNYGTAKPDIQASNIPCGGCGAALHCRDTSLPGFMPSERFTGLVNDELRKELCQRCLFLQHYNVALNVTVHQKEYANVMSVVKDSTGLIVLLVDLTDFPCSIWPGILDIVGPDKPVIVLGNKVDLLARDQPGYLDRIKETLLNNLKEQGIELGRNLIYCGLISAKTGYGIESVISKLQKFWGFKDDVYIIGCTNVGKSTLFNALLQSDYCKVQASDLVQRATTSIWPGTTLNLLKFPIMRPEGWRMFLRVKRLIKESRLIRNENLLKESMYRETRNPKYITLVGRIGMTFKENNPEDDFSLQINSKEAFDPENKMFREGHFCHDTPGALYTDQILDLLTVDELMKTLSRKIIHPRTFCLKPNQTLFLAGLGRIDFVSLNTGGFSLLTVFACPDLPIHIVPLEDGDKFYEHNLGTSLLGVPIGGKERLSTFPALEGKTFEIEGKGRNESCADLVLSSAGWIGITLDNGRMATLKVYTPAGRGIYCRQPALLPFAVQNRGKRINKTPAYENKYIAPVVIK